MDSKPNFPVLVLPVLLGVGSIVRFSSDVRPVQVVGISGGGAACGVALFSFIFAAIHPQGLMVIPPLMFMAFGFSLAREWRGSLLPSMFAHGMSNGAVLMLATFALSK